MCNESTVNGGYGFEEHSQADAVLEIGSSLGELGSQPAGVSLVDGCALQLPNIAAGNLPFPPENVE